jgi:hypothetical protein
VNRPILVGWLWVVFVLNFFASIAGLLALFTPANERAITWISIPLGLSAIPGGFLAVLETLDRAVRSIADEIKVAPASIAEALRLAATARQREQKAADSPK